MDPLLIIRTFAARMAGSARSGWEQTRELERRFTEITSRSSQLISSICLSFATTREEFEDLRQDTFLNIWRGMEKFRSESNLSTWVYRVTLNTCVSHLRKSKRREVQSAAAEEFYRELFDDSTQEEIERYELMYRLIERLSPLDKAALLMWLDDKSYEEIMEVTGLSRDAVASRLKRARTRLSAMAETEKRTR